MRDEIALLPVGSVDPLTLARMRVLIEPIFFKQVAILRPIQIPEVALNPTRRQYHSTTVLKLLNRTLGGRFHRMLALTTVDLFVPQLNYVFGEADVLNGMAIVSIARLRPQFYGLRAEEDVTEKRLEKEVIHEIGHTYNLSHCENPLCVMYFSNNIQDTDRKLSDFCKECKKMLVEHMAPQFARQ